MNSGRFSVVCRFIDDQFFTCRIYVPQRLGWRSPVCWIFVAKRFLSVLTVRFLQVYSDINPVAYLYWESLPSLMYRALEYMPASHRTMCTLTSGSPVYLASCQDVTGLSTYCKTACLWTDWKSVHLLVIFENAYIPPCTTAWPTGFGPIICAYRIAVWYFTSGTYWTETV